LAKPTSTHLRWAPAPRVVDMPPRSVSAVRSGLQPQVARWPANVNAMTVSRLAAHMHAATAPVAVPRSWQLWLHMDAMYQSQYRIEGGPVLHRAGCLCCQCSCTSIPLSCTRSLLTCTALEIRPMPWAGRPSTCRGTCMHASP
jgi:hypothetical protein